MTRNRSMVALVLVTFFVISLLTNILGPIVPDIIAGFHVSLTAAGFLAFAFFIAYGVMSIPAGFLVERFSEKPVMMLAFLAAGLGSLSFALFPGYRMAMGSYFVIGAGMAVLQVAINPLLRVSGGEENYAFYSAFAQLVFGSASFVSPRIYSFLVSRLGSTTTHRNVVLRVLANLTPPHLPWASIYWIFTVSAFAMVFVLALSHFPKVKHTAEERPGSLAMYKTLLRQRVVWLYFAAMFAYVSCEQGAADWMSSFLQLYHGFDPHSAGATAVSWFWGLLTAGCLGGMLLLKFFDSRKVLIGASVGALGCLSAALFGSARLSLIAFPAIGLFAS
ncbi:MAG TPA: MFS transporter, partial [Candidatus Acidoferrum sp.]